MACCAWRGVPYRAMLPKMRSAQGTCAADPVGAPTAAQGAGSILCGGSLLPRRLSLIVYGSAPWGWGPRADAAGRPHPDLLALRPHYLSPVSWRVQERAALTAPALVLGADTRPFVQRRPEDVDDDAQRRRRGAMVRQAGQCTRRAGSMYAQGVMASSLSLSHRASANNATYYLRKWAFRHRRPRQAD